MCAQRVDNKYCLPIIKSSRAEVEEALKKNINRFRYAEVWLDYVEDIDPGFAASLVGHYPNRLVMVFRRRNLGAMKLDADTRFKIMSTLARKQVLVDMDITVQSDDISRVQANRLSLKSILSYHNFSQTPSDTVLRSIVSRMKGYNAHIVKVATHCTTQRDALRLLSLLIDLRESGQRSIILGMGKHGVITRVFGSVWGNEMAFAPLDAAQRSAAGQLTVDKLDSIMQALG